jgi:hypothetical protein
MAGKAKKKETLLEIIAEILDFAKGSGLNDAFMEKAGPRLKTAAKSMGITPIQTALFAFIFDTTVLTVRGEKGRANSLFAALKCSKIKYLQYLNEIDVLVKKNYVERVLDNHELSRYIIPRNIIFTLRKGKKIRPENNKNISINKFFEILDRIFKSRYNDEMLFNELNDSLESLFQNNPHLEFTKKLQSYNLGEQDRNLLVYICNKTINSHESANLERIKKQFSDDEDDFEVHFSLICPLTEGNHILQEMKLIENTNDNGFAVKDEFILTDKATDELLCELRGKQKINKNDFLPAVDIKEKRMFYNAGEEEKIEKLVSLLEPSHFRDIIDRLGEKGLRKGFACLFSGFPGTGKTETVYQIARRTGRDLMPIDVSQIKSMWVGESEKNIKNIFTRYKDAVEKSRNAPILFLNEADAVIGKRRELNDGSRAVDQMENTMQNIILQEIENLDGILIATTNLNKNLDRAFDRRFLYKIEFGKPDIEVRKNLWFSMIGGLHENAVSILASQFCFTGGQIENIARKRQIDIALNGAEPGLNELIAYCEDEYLEKNDEMKIGFAV